MIHSSRLLASYKGVGILRPDGETQAGADVLALTVGTDYMPNEDWQVICQRGRALREAEGILTGHAAGHNLDTRTPELDHAAAVHAIGDGTARRSRSEGVPEFISTADLAEVLDFDSAWLGRRLAELGCQSTPGTRRVRGRPDPTDPGLPDRRSPRFRCGSAGP